MQPKTNAKPVCTIGWDGNTYDLKVNGRTHYYGRGAFSAFREQVLKQLDAMRDQAEREKRPPPPEDIANKHPF